MAKIPGFCAIVKALLQELKAMQLSQDRDCIVETTRLLSKHEWFVPVFIQIILTKINAFVGRDVANGMAWISQLLQECETLPTSFSFSTFGNVMQVLDERFDHEIGVHRTLLLLYHNLQKFPLAKRFTLIDNLLSKELFHRLFFHWSYNVRQVFCKVMMFQLEYFFVIKTCNSIGLNYDRASYFDTEHLFFSMDPDTEEGAIITTLKRCEEDLLSQFKSGQNASHA